MNRRQFVYSGAGAAAWVTLPACVQGEDPTSGMNGVRDCWVVQLQGPNGFHIPQILGASGSIDSPLGFTGFDYFEWFGITHNRYFFDLAISPLNPTGGVTDEASFKTATEAVRLDPLRQGTSEDVYIDWAALDLPPEISTS